MATKSQFSSDLSDLLEPFFGLLVNIGNVWFVDSGNTSASDASGNGRKVSTPFSTLAYAVGQVTATNGDIVIVSPGHSETITVADGLRFGLAGIQVIGLGSGTARPTINFTTVVGADMEVDAANITLRNFYLDMTGFDNITAGIDVNAAYFRMFDCEILMADSGGQAAIAIELDGDADNCKFIRCEFSAINAGAASAIKINGALTNLEIANCWIDGDFTDACIHNPTGNVATQLLIRDCFLKNDNTGEHSIELVSACTGMLVRNLYHSDMTQGTAVDPGSCFSYESYQDDVIDTSGILTPAAT